MNIINWHRKKSFSLVTTNSGLGEFVKDCFLLSLKYILSHRITLSYRKVSPNGFEAYEKKVLPQVSKNYAQQTSESVIKKNCYEPDDLK